MSYKLRFDKRAEKEWHKLDSSNKAQFFKKLAERRKNPRVPGAKLSKMKDCYKIKLRKSGYRLVYQVVEQEITILVVAIGKREDNQIYLDAQSRLN